MQVDPSKPAEEAQLLNLAMKVILVVAIVSIVSIVIFVGLLSILPPVVSTHPDPDVELGVPDNVGWGRWQVDVEGVSETKDLGDWRAILLKNGIVEDDMNPLVWGLVTDHMIFIDIDGGGTLSVGDYFSISCDPGSSYQLSIIWRNSGNVRGSQEWQT